MAREKGLALPMAIQELVKEQFAAEIISVGQTKRVRADTGPPDAKYPRLY